MKKIEKASFVLALIVGIAALLGFVFFVVEIFGTQTIYNFDSIIKAMSNYINDLMKGNIYVAIFIFIGWIAVPFLLFVALLIVSVVKGRKVGIFHSIVILVAGALTIFAVPLIEKFIGGLEAYKSIVYGRDFTLMGAIYMALAVVSMLCAIALFVVDCVAKKQPAFVYPVLEEKEKTLSEQPDKAVAETVKTQPVSTKNKEKPKNTKSKPAPKKVETKKPAPKKKVAVKKPAQTKTKKVDAKPAPAISNKEYSISRHLKMNKWQFKEVGSNKAIRLFNTKEQALEYAKKYVKEHGGFVVAHGM